MRVQMVEASAGFKSELGRHTYVTPTSYLELITLFQQLLAQKRAENEKAYSRYSTGLQKLQSSSEQVSVMQIELRVSCAFSLVNVKIIAVDAACLIRAVKTSETIAALTAHCCVAIQSQMTCVLARFVISGCANVHQRGPLNCCVHTCTNNDAYDHLPKLIRRSKVWRMHESQIQTGKPLRGIRLLCFKNAAAPSLLQFSLSVCRNCNLS